MKKAVKSRTMDEIDTYATVSPNPRHTGKTVCSFHFSQLNKHTHCFKYRGIYLKKHLEAKEKYIEHIM